MTEIRVLHPSLCAVGGAEILLLEQVELLDRRLDWLVQGMERVDVAIAHNYPTSSLLGMAGTPPVRIWYCHEPPRTLYVDDANPYLPENVGRAPGSDAEHIYRRMHGRGLRGVYRRAQRRRDAELDRRGITGLTSIWANSEYTRDNVKRVYGATDVHVVYPIVGHATNGTRRAGLRKDGRKILCLTRLHWLKSIDM